MRRLSANATAMLARADCSPYYLVKIVSFSNGTSMETNSATAITIPGLGTFNPSDSLMTIEAPRLSETVDRETYKVAYIDPNFTKVAYFEAGLTGASFTVYVGFYNTTGATFAGAAPGAPITNLADLVIAYSGVIDTQGFSIDPESGTVVAVIEGSSPMACLGRVNSFYTSQENMLRVSGGDTSFDQIYTGSARINLLWGKSQ